MFDDWFTIIAQLVNFLILVALLRYFLYGRILEAMDKRESEIASRWENAEEARDKSEKKEEEYRRKNQELENEREETLARSREEAKDLRHELVKKAKAEIERLKKNWLRSLEREKDAFLRELRRQAAKGACSVTRRFLEDMADTDLEQQIVQVFLHQIEELAPQERQKMQHSDGHSAVVRTAFEVPDETRLRIEKTLREQFENLEVEFETEADLLCGIELTRGGHRIAWSIEDYLGGLQEEIIATLESRFEDSSEESKDNEEDDTEGETQT